MAIAKVNVTASSNEDLKIDRHDLEEEWLKQPVLFHKWAVENTNCYRQVEILKRKLEIARAEADERARQSLGGAEERITETKVLRLVNTDSQVMRVQDDLSLANAVMADAAAMRDALGHKKTSLEFLTRLQLSDWNAEPRIPVRDREVPNDRTRNALVDGLNPHSPTVPRKVGG